MKNNRIIKTILISLLLLIFIVPTNVLAGFSDNLTSTNQQIQTSCWTNPTAPNLISPADNTTTALGDVTFAWNAATSSCPTAEVSYRFQIYTDITLTTLYQESPWQSPTNYTILSIPEDEYWWKVTAKDQFSNQTASSTYHLIVDRTSPSVSLSISGSYTKSVEEKITNGDFESGDLAGFTKAGDVTVVSSETISNPAAGTPASVTPYQGSSMVRVGRQTDPGKQVWENRLMQSFSSGAKALSFQYNFFSRDYSPYDEPGFFTRINGQEIFKINAASVNPLSDTSEAAYTSGWQQFNYDLSSYDSGQINLSLDAGNTADSSRQSWVYLDKLTTYFVTAPAHAAYNLNGSDSSSGINHYEYKIDGEDWQTGSSFAISTGGSHDLQYKAVDNAGNNSPIHLVKVITDTTSPSQVNDLAATADINSVALSWTAPGNDGTSGKASKYDLRSQKDCSDPSSFNFDTASKVDQLASPQEFGQAEEFVVPGLNPSTSYCFGLKSADEAPNWSALSNVIAVSTLAGSTVNPGDLVINELMWMGTSANTSDEYIELRNLTDHDINLANFKLTKYSSGSEVDMITIPSGNTIPAHGYFLIGNNSSATQLKNSANLWNSGVTLSNSTLQIKLKDNAGNTLDIAWDQTAPTEGLYNSGLGQYYSMERTTIPGDGSNPLNWYTCIDSLSHSDFFNGSSDERGTPGAVNRSENMPLPPESTSSAIPTASDSGISRNAPTDTATPSADLTPTPTPEASPSAEPIPTSSETPDPIPSPTETPTPSPTQPEPTPTPIITPTPIQEEVKIDDQNP